MSEKIYSQEDLDNIVNKSKSNLEEKYSKTHIAIKDYEVIQNENFEFKASAKKNEFKEIFIKNNGNPSAFEDFYSVEKDKLSKLEQGNIENYFKETSSKKGFYFNNGNTAQVVEEQPHLNQFEKELIRAGVGKVDTNNNLVDGTIYAKNAINLFTSKRK